MTKTKSPKSNSSPSENSTSIPAYGNSDKESHWFPMRLNEGQDILKIRKELNKLKVKYFLPTRAEIVPCKTGGYKKSRVPMLNDLIFVYTTKAHLTELKHSNSTCHHLRFVTFIPIEDNKANMTPMERSAVNRIVIIPKKDFKEFIKVVKDNDQKVTLIPYSEAFNNIGRKIRILQGPLAGTIGTLRRIKNNKHVHFDFGGIVTAELGYVPKEMYELIQ